MTKRFKSPISLMILLCSIVLLFLPTSLSGQTTTAPTRDPNAVALAGRALQALAGVTPLSDITLQATATYIAGSDQEMGPATLVALGNQQSLVTLNLTNGTRQEIRNGNEGAWTGPGGNPHAMAPHNCFVDADWFFPALSLVALASDPALGISLVGQEGHDGVPTYHLVLFRSVAEQTADYASLVQQASVMDLYLGAPSLLPVAVGFAIHPDTDATVNIPVEVRFASYQSFNGVLVPMHIQEFIQNSLVLDLAATKAAVNSGVPGSVFTLPGVSMGGVQ